VQKTQSNNISEKSQTHQPSQVPVWYAQKQPKNKVTVNKITYVNNNRYKQINMIHEL